jgi:epoxyqueuosine reductase
LDKRGLTDALKAEAHQLGFQLVGAAPAVAMPSYQRLVQWVQRGYFGPLHYAAARLAAYRHPQHLLPGVRSILMLGLSYRTVEPAPPGAGQGSVARYAWGVDYHRVIRARLRRLADFHRRMLPSAGVRGVVDTAPLAEKVFGWLAGLGRIGRNTTLINDQYGSWFFLGALLTSAELEYDVPQQGDPCGRCRACIEACPTGALVEPYVLDARSCLSCLTIEQRGPIPLPLRGKLGLRVFGCDTCQEVCPWNKTAACSAEPAFRPLPGNNPLELKEVLTLNEAAFANRFRRTVLLRAGRSGLLRNAAIVLGNQAAEDVLPVLRLAADDPDPVVAEAARWAIGKSQTADRAGAHPAQASSGTHSSADRTD